jgi:tetratricopeptide (TPR) repeat protein
MQPPNRRRTFLIFLALPILSFVAVTLCLRNPTFYYSSKVTFPNDSTFSQNFDWCGGKSGVTPEKQIAGCTGLIQSGRGNQKGLSEAFYNRGNGYAAKDDFDHAIQDFDQAIKLNPNDAAAFNNRGLSYAHKRQYDRAIEDYDQAIKLDPNYAVALSNRANSMAKKEK